MYNDDNISANDDMEKNQEESAEKDTEQNDVSDTKAAETTDATENAEPADKEQTEAKTENVVGDEGKKPAANTSKPNNSNVSFYKKRSFKYGSMATAFTAIFIAIVILVNFALTLLSEKYPLSIDLTKSKDYGISQTTIDYLAKVKQPIAIKVFATKDQMESQSELVTPMKIIQQFPKYCSNISIQYLDYDKNPTAVSKYSSENINQYDIVVETTTNGKDRYKHISYYDLLVTTTDTSTYQTTVVGNKAEQEIDSALDYVTSTNLSTVLFTEGHDEVDSSSLQDLYKDGNYDVQTVNTATSAIDSKASSLVIVAPQTDFSDGEIDKIDKFLKNDGKFGKNIFIFLDPRCPTLPKLEEYMSEWGIKAETGVIYDTKNSFDNNPFDPAATNLDTGTVGSSVSTGVGTDVKIARPLTIMFDSKNSRTVTSVIKTNDTSKLLKDLSGQPSDGDKKGPFTVMSRTIWASSDNTTKSNMIVSGSYEITDSDLLNASNKNNSKVLLGIADTLMEKESAVSVSMKYNTSSQLDLLTSQRYIIILLFIVIIPLAILVLGLVQWLRRRHL